MKCKLCQQEAPLCDSHIIPEFFYKFLYDDNHKFYIASLDPNDRKWFASKGFKEKLLCLECEGRLNKFETYVTSLYGEKSRITYTEHEHYYAYSNINYKLFKLFQLSIIWRVSVSNLSEFDLVDIGPHEEKIRLMILQENPGTFLEYGCLMAALIKDEKPLFEVIRQPSEISRIENQRTYQCIFGGFIWTYFITSNTKELSLKDLFIKPNNELIALKIQFSKHKKLISSLIDTTSKSRLNEVFEEMEKTGKTF